MVLGAVGDYRSEVKKFYVEVDENLGDVPDILGIRAQRIDRF